MTEINAVAGADLIEIIAVEAVAEAIAAEVEATAVIVEETEAAIAEAVATVEIAADVSSKVSTSR